MADYTKAAEGVGAFAIVVAIAVYIIAAVVPGAFSSLFSATGWGSASATVVYTLLTLVLGIVIAYAFIKKFLTA